MNIRQASSGIGHIAVLLIIVVIVGVASAGVYVYKKNQSSTNDTGSTKNDKTNNTKTDSYAGWKTAALASPQLEFRYPADWTIATTADGKNIEVKSPTSDGHYLTVSLISGKSQDVNLNFLGMASGTTISNLTVDGRALYLVAQTAGDNGAVTGLGLATTPGSADTSFGIIDPQRTNNLTMVASLIPVTPTADDDGAEYAMEAYTGHPSYQDVLKVFGSLTGSLPE